MDGESGNWAGARRGAKKKTTQMFVNVAAAALHTSVCLSHPQFPMASLSRPAAAAAPAAASGTSTLIGQNGRLFAEVPMLAEERARRLARALLRSSPRLSIPGLVGLPSRGLSVSGELVFFFFFFMF